MTRPARDATERPSKTVVDREWTVIQLDTKLSPAKIRARALRKLHRDAHKDRIEWKALNTHSHR